MSVRVAPLLLALLLSACGDDRRDNWRSEPPGAGRDYVRSSELVPGGRVGGGIDRPNPYSGDPVAINEGERLYSWFNCIGCHAGGGGGIGPALMDKKWIYGSRPSAVYDSIVAGRPNGMPAFGGMIPEQQVWQIVAYIESMGGMDPQDKDQRSGGGRADPPPQPPGGDPGRGGKDS
jgi:cytochrome c oxidase cbb3-type subunit III